MALWPGPDRKFIPVTRIWVESPEERFERERQQGRTEWQQRDDVLTARRFQEQQQAALHMSRAEDAERWAAQQQAAWDESIAENPQGHWQQVIMELSEERYKIERQLQAAVLSAIDSGVTWTDVGSCIGVSRQAARKRYGPGGRGADIERDRLKRKT